MNKIAILTPASDSDWQASRWREVGDRMIAPLKATGLEIETRDWKEAEDLRSFGLVMPLLVWGYHLSDAWQDTVTRWETDGVRLQNPAPVLRWNADKLYLRRLEANNVPIVPTIFLDRVDEAALMDAAEKFGTDRLVAKPRISAGAFQTIRWSAGQSISDGPTGAAMIQPYLPEIENSGEVSLIYLGGAFSHAISKVPQPGDFRVQPEYDGIIAAYAPTSEELAVAEAALRAADTDLLYARVDLVRDLDKKPVVIELELVEPDLYLGYDPEAPARFVKAVTDALDRRGL
jgi:glutathione synthase/RimK-type ligase-like ATP-grasp enzyme